jgi:hypothetical protein
VSRNVRGLSPLVVELVVTKLRRLMGRRNVTKSPKSSTPSAGIRPREGQGLAGPGRPLANATFTRNFQSSARGHPVLPISKAGPVQVPSAPVVAFFRVGSATGSLISLLLRKVHDLRRGKSLCPPLAEASNLEQRCRCGRSVFQMKRRRGDLFST